MTMRAPPGLLLLLLLLLIFFPSFLFAVVLGSVDVDVDVDVVVALEATKARLPTPPPPLSSHDDDDDDGDEDEEEVAAAAADEAAVRIIMDDILDRSDDGQLSTRRRSSASALFLTRSSSPKCWTASLAAIGRWNGDDVGVGDGNGDNNGYGGGGGTTGTTTGGGVVHPTGRSYCASMTSGMHEALALELTRCQLTKERRPFYDDDARDDDDDDEPVYGHNCGGREVRGADDAIEPARRGDDDDCRPHDQRRRRRQRQQQHRPHCAVGTGRPYDPSSCLPLMTEYALNLYHQILLHVGDVCARLAEDAIVLRREEITEDLVAASSAAALRMRTIVVDHADAVERMASHASTTMIDRQKEALARMEDEMRSMAVERRRREEDESSAAMGRMRASLLEGQRSLMGEMIAESRRAHDEREWAAADALAGAVDATTAFLWEHAERTGREREERERDLRAREEEASAAVERTRIEAAAAIAEQAERMREQGRDLERLRETISSANSQMRPLTAIGSYVKLAAGGLALARGLPNLLLSMIAAWMVAAMITPRPVRARRRRLFAVLASGFLAEIAAAARFVPDGGGDGVVGAFFLAAGVDDAAGAIGLVRAWTRASAVATLVLSSLPARFSSPPTTRGDGDGDDDDGGDVRPSAAVVEDLLRSHVELVARLNAASSGAATEAGLGEGDESSATVEPRDERGGSRERRTMRRYGGHSLIAPSTRNSKPGRRRSGSPRRSYSTGPAAPVVTPIAPRARKEAVAAAAPRPDTADYQSTYHARRFEGLARGERETRRTGPEFARALPSETAGGTSGGASGGEGGSSGGDEDRSSRSPGESSPGSPSPYARRNNRKRKVAEMYYCAPGDEEGSDSADRADDDEEEMSESYATAPSDDDEESSTEIREKKKSKLDEVWVR